MTKLTEEEMLELERLCPSLFYASSDSIKAVIVQRREENETLKAQLANCEEALREGLEGYQALKAENEKLKAELNARDERDMHEAIFDAQHD